MSDSDFVYEVEKFIKSAKCDNNVKQQIQNIIQQSQNKVETDGKKLRELIILDNQPIPDELLYDSCVAYYPGNTVDNDVDGDRYWDNLQMFIANRQNEPIPEKMLRGYKVHGYDTPLMIWITYRKGEPIPQQLFDIMDINTDYHKTQCYRDNLICQWLMCRTDEMLPKSLTYPGWLRRVIYLLQYTMCNESHYYSDAKMSENMRKTFIKNYIAPAITKYTAIIGTSEIRDSEYKCKYCHDQDGFYKVNVKLNLPYNERDDSISYCLNHFTDAYKTLKDLTKNVLNLDYSAIEQLIDYAE